MATNLGAGRRVDLYLRGETSPAVAEQQRRVRSRLERSLGQGELAVHEHPKRVPAAGGDAVAEAFEDVRAWASEAGVSLSPFFESRETYDPDAERVREMVTLPVLWMTLSDGEDVRATYPHVDREVETVSDAVEDLVAEAPEGDAAD